MINRPVFPMPSEVPPPQFVAIDKLPPPSAFMNFPGDQTRRIGKAAGTRRCSSDLTIVSVDFDAESNRSRVGFAYGSYFLDPAA